MALPAVVGAWLTPVLAQVGRWLFLTYAGKMVLSAMAFLGITLASHQFVVTPFINTVKGHWHGIPSDLAVWLGALGIDHAVSVLLSAHAVSAASRVFLKRVGSKK